MIFNTSYLIDAAACVGINLATLLAFGRDKHRARLGRRRIPEATLLRLAFFGGSGGAKTAQRHFRHKTYKQPSGGQPNAILLLPVIVVTPLLCHRPAPRSRSSCAPGNPARCRDIILWRRRCPD